jgi:hypothetical protein
MEIAKIVLEYLRVLIWPLVVIYLAVSHKTAITRLIGRITRVNFPGGGLETKYNPEDLSKGNDEQVLLPTSAEASKSLSSDQLKDRIDRLDQEFSKHLFLDLQSNRRIIANLVDVAWRKYGLGLFGRESAQVSFSGKVEALGVRIDAKALDDLEYIKTILAKKPLLREELMQAYFKSKLLVDYFRGLATRG